MLAKYLQNIALILTFRKLPCFPAQENIVHLHAGQSVCKVLRADAEASECCT